MATNITWTDATQWPLEGAGWSDTARRFDRLPARAEADVEEVIWNLSRLSTGLRLRFVTDSPTIHVRYDLLNAGLAMPHMPATAHSGVDLYAEDDTGVERWVGVSQPTEQQVTAVLADGLRPSGRQYTLYLPLYNSPESLHIGVAEGSHLEPVAARETKPIVFYGTSILHGASASRPGMAFPAQLGRRLEMPFINLGFSGNGRMQPEVVALLAELDAAAFVIDCLPNMTGDAVAERTVPTVERLRQHHPETPILLVEDRTYGNTRFLEAKRQRHLGSRAALRAGWRQLVEAGDRNLHYLQGDGLLPVDGDATVDSSHPTDLGMAAYADAYEPVLRSLLHIR